MPTSPFLEVGTTTPHKMVGDASDYTKMIRLSAQIAPYLASNTNAAPRLGWKSSTLSAEARYTLPLFATIRSRFTR